MRCVNCSKHDLHNLQFQDVRRHISFDANGDTVFTANRISLRLLSILNVSPEVVSFVLRTDNCPFAANIQRTIHKLHMEMKENDY